MTTKKRKLSSAQAAAMGRRGAAKSPWRSQIRFTTPAGVKKLIEMNKLKKLEKNSEILHVDGVKDGNKETN